MLTHVNVGKSHRFVVTSTCLAVTLIFAVVAILAYRSLGHLRARLRSVQPLSLPSILDTYEEQRQLMNATLRRIVSNPKARSLSLDRYRFALRLENEYKMGESDMGFLDAELFPIGKSDTVYLYQQGGYSGIETLRCFRQRNHRDYLVYSVKLKRAKKAHSVRTIKNLLDYIHGAGDELQSGASEAARKDLKQDRSYVIYRTIVPIGAITAALTSDIRDGSAFVDGPRYDIDRDPITGNQISDSREFHSRYGLPVAPSEFAEIERADRNVKRR